MKAKKSNSGKSVYINQIHGSPSPEYILQENIDGVIVRVKGRYGTTTFPAEV